MFVYICTIDRNKESVNISKCLNGKYLFICIWNGWYLVFESIFLLICLSYFLSYFHFFIYLSSTSVLRLFNELIQ